MRPLTSLTALALLLAAACSSPDTGGPRILTFSSGWYAAETNGTGNPAAWGVLPDGQIRREVLEVQTSNTGQTYNLFLTDNAEVTDVDLGVTLRAVSGEEDRGGGLVWRAQDADNYYVARWNPLEDNVRVYKVVNGVRTQFQSRTVHIDPLGWHHIRVVAEGPRMTVYLNGKQVLEHADQTFLGPGAVGLWTKADACVLFDDFEVVW